MSALREPEQRAVPVHGGNLAVRHWPATAPGAPIVVLLHGLTDDGAVWVSVAGALAGDFDVWAPDLRGRGGSAGLPEPYGIETHAADVAALLDGIGGDGAAGVGATVLVGHDLGAFVATVAAAGIARDLMHGLVLVDGGPALPVPPGADTDAAVTALLGPGEPATAALAEAVHFDAGDMLLNERVLEAVDDLPVPATLLWAEYGPQGERPGLYDDVRLERLGLDLLRVTARPVPGTDHATILSAPEGVSAIAAAVREAALRSG